MSKISNELYDVFNKISVASQSHISIDGRYWGVITDIDGDDMEIVLEKLKAIPILTNRAHRVTVNDLVGHFDNEHELAYKFMFAICLFQNKFGTPIFTVAPFGNHDALNYQGEVNNIVLPQKAKSQKVEKPTTNIKKEKEVIKPRKKRETKKKPETKPTAKRTTKKRK